MGGLNFWRREFLLKGGAGRRKVSALTLSVNNFLKIQPNAAKLCDFI